jgi:uncharacterized membrane protein YhaH (DUF805 family)
LELLRYIFGFEGRINRAHIWVGAILNLILSNVFDLLSPLGTRVFGQVIGEIIFGGINLLLIASFISLEVRRLHDRNKSGWWLLLQSLPFVVLIAFLYILSGSEDASTNTGIAQHLLTWASLPVWAVFIWFFVQLFCLRGTIGPNRFGPDPLESNLTQIEPKVVRD